MRATRCSESARELVSRRRREKKGRTWVAVDDVNVPHEHAAFHVAAVQQPVVRVDAEANVPNVALLKAVLDQLLRCIVLSWPRVRHSTRA